MAINIKNLHHVVASVSIVDVGDLTKATTNAGGTMN